MRHMGWLGFAALMAASGAQARTMTPRDLVTLDRISDPHLSPDGRTIVYDVRSTDYDANMGVHAVWIVCPSCLTGAPRRLAISDKGATAPRFSADGHTLYFLSARSGTNQLWRADISASPQGGDPVQVTSLPLDIGSYRVAPDGRSVVVSLSVFPDCATPDCTKQRLDGKAAQKAAGTLYTKLFVRHWDNWADGTRNQLWTIKLGADGRPAGPAIPLMRGFDGDSPSKPFGGEDDFTISPDSRSVVFSARQAGRSEPWSTNFDLYTVSLDGSAAPRDITASNPAWDAAPAFSPDGRTLAYKATRRTGFEADRFAIMLRDLATGTTRELAPSWDRSADTLRWAADGKTLYVTAADTGHELLFALDAQTGVATPLTMDGHVSDIDVAGGTVVYARDSLAGPTQLYTWPGNAPTQAGDARQMSGLTLAPYEQFSFPGWNNETVHGYVMPPANAQPGQKYPVAFLVHGGPQGSFGDSWSYRWNPQTYAARGYAAVFIDFHGSTGYGQAFTDAISGHWGDRPLADLQAGWHAALAKYPYLDAGRACALGASYGGYMIYWMEGVWNAPWRCLVDHDGVFDNRMMGYSTDELWFSEWENGHATPWAQPGNYERFNPVTRVADWKTPMLVIHSAKDFRIPIEQGLAAFTALQRRGVPSELLTFPDENHWVLKPQNSELWQNTVLDWLDRWTAQAPAK